MSEAESAVFRLAVGDSQSSTGPGQQLNSLLQTGIGFVRYSNVSFKTYIDSEPEGRF
jgi:hypothetical protein